MAKVRDENYITIQGWMVTQLGLKGNELLLYALIYGFSQGEGCYTGGLQYAMDWLNCSKPTAIAALKALTDKGLIEREEMEVNNVKVVNYRCADLTGGKKTLPGVVKEFNQGGKEILPNNKDIYKDINNNPPISSLPEDVQTAFNTLQAPDDATATHKLVSSTLINLGFDVTNEYPVTDRGDGRRGRIDVFAERNGCRIAIEIDQSTPRVKSVFKLKSIENCFRLILLRNYDGNPHGCELPVIVLKSKEEQDFNAQRFESFWQMYPNKKAKTNARKAWDKLKVDGSLYTEIMKGLTLHKKSRDWIKDEGQFIPHPATWLNGRRWEDEVEQEPTRKVEKLTRW